MCTAVTYHPRDHYFGRNLDLEYHYAESVTITPRNFPLPFRRKEALKQHFAIIGMAAVELGYPLYYDATNEHGLSMAGLNFPENAVYYEEKVDKDNITHFEFIPWILGQCRSVADAEKLLCKLNLIDLPFSESFGLSPLHWIIADSMRSIVVEPMADGTHIYDDPVGILTNNPPFPYHMYRLTDYLNLTRETPTSRFAEAASLTPYSNGMGAIGLPGDLSSSSRFVRAAFTKLNSVCDCDEGSAVSQFFHILSSVAQQKGCCRTPHGFEKTIYSSCCNTDRGIYYYTTYNNSQITAVNMHKEELNGASLIAYPLNNKEQIHYLNG